MQALINPALYGIKWRSWFMGVQVMELNGVAVEDGSSMAPLEGPNKGNPVLLA